MDDELSLGEAAPEPLEPKDALPDPATFRVADFAEGIRPGRREVVLRINLHLYPQLQELAARIENDFEAGLPVDELVDEFDALKDRMQLRVILERRSPEWVERLVKTVSQEMGLPAPGRAGKKKAKQLSDAQAAELGMRWALAQTVEPEGLTLGYLMALYAEDPTEIDKLARAVAAVNQGASTAQALMLDFSRLRSDRRLTPERAES